LAAARPNALVAAVLKEVPGAASTRAQRIAWLKMIAMAIDTAYGADGDAIDLPSFLGGGLSDVAPAASATSAVASSAPPKPQLVRVVEPPRFFIDFAGAARHAPSMEAINPEQVAGETLFDDRGEHGDLGSILWADGRRGVLGLQLSISATPIAKLA